MSFILKLLRREGKKQRVYLVSTGRSKTSGISVKESDTVKDALLVLEKDAVVAGIIRKMVVDICGELYVDEDSEEGRFLSTSTLWYKLKRLLPLLVRDMLSLGNAYLERIYENGRLVDIKYLDARYVTPEEEDGVLVVEDGDIAGYRYKPEGWYIIARRKSITGEELTKGLYLDRKHVAHIRMFSPTGNLVGEGLPARLKWITQIRLNIEEALGETASRHVDDVWIVWVGDESGRMPMVSESELVELKEEIEKAKGLRADVLAFPSYVKFDRLTGGDLSNYVKPLESMLTETYLALNYPYGFELGKKLHATSPEENYWERNIDFYRRWILDQLIVEVIAPYMESNGYSRVPKIEWRSINPTELMSKARRLSLYARTNLVTPDPALEDHLRRLEALPKKTQKIEQMG